MELSKAIFWDTDYATLDWDKHPRYVIERVMTYGTLADWRQITAYYGMDKIKLEMLQVRNMDAKVLSFLSFFFKIPKEEFRCYKQKQSTHKPFDC